VPYLKCKLKPIERLAAWLLRCKAELINALPKLDDASTCCCRQLQTKNRRKIYFAKVRHPQHGQTVASTHLTSLSDERPRRRAYSGST